MEKFSKLKNVLKIRERKRNLDDEHKEIVLNALIPVLKVEETGLNELIETSIALKKMMVEGL